MADQQSVLPKGIVLNREAVYAELAQYDTVPVEQILNACKVFTTTSRELYDPTARRLENFWSRVLGGNRRYLPGSVIARLFRDISETSFVKLRGPANRYEPPSPESLAAKPAGANAASAPPQPKLDGPAPRHKGKATATSARVPHPILKKPRGPSASGPRPTARFVSPPGSGAEEPASITSNVAATHSLDSKESSSSTAREDKRKVHGVRPKKKTTAFVASTASRRRPAMPRRSSSQSSTGTSEIGSKEGGSSLGSKYGSQNSVPTIPERPEQPSRKATEPDNTATLSAKAAGKRPVTQTHIESSTSTKASQGKPIKRAQQSNTSEPRLPESPSDRSSIDIGPQSSTTRERRGVATPSSLMSSTPAKLDTSVIGQGTISGFTSCGVTPQRDGLDAGFTGLDIGEAISRDSTTAAFPVTFTPTQPSNTSSVPLGRSKSQLSLLLDRQGEKKSKR
ncbi:hypothetical protein F5Y16DRAFT_403260 [Xylariaceae sp. FL0255]|nr:hypothetical protein F5Y16DRAFT_403260 [Xylariaceae sp. FL0255]